jgi:hypothetical protein
VEKKMLEKETKHAFEIKLISILIQHIAKLMFNIINFLSVHAYVSYVKATQLIN